MTAPMPETMSPREKVEYDHSLSNEENYRRFKAHVTALASSGDHAELARLAEAAKSEWPDGAWFRDYELEYGERGQIDQTDAAFIAAANPATVLALIAENTALRGERDQISGESIWWKGVIGDGSHQPSGEVRSIKHLHPEMVKPIYEAHKGTAVADVIAGLIFSLAINQNREQFLVSHANDRVTEAERKLAEADKALELAAIRLDEIYEAAEVDDVAYRNEATIHSINGLAGVAQAEIRTFLSSKEAERG